MVGVRIFGIARITRGILSTEMKDLLENKMSLQPGKCHSKLGAMIIRPASLVVTMTMSMQMEISNRAWDQQS